MSMRCLALSLAVSLAPLVEPSAAVPELTAPRPACTAPGDALLRIASIQDLGPAQDGRPLRFTSTGFTTVAAEELTPPSDVPDCSARGRRVLWRDRNVHGAWIGVELAQRDEAGTALREGAGVAIRCDAGARAELALAGQASSEPFAIDDLGRVVGRSIGSDGVAHAFFFDGVETLDLDGLLERLPSWQLRAAYDIDAFGRILAVAEVDGDPRQVLLRLAPSAGGASTVVLPPIGGGVRVTRINLPSLPSPGTPFPFELRFPCEDWGFEDNSFGGWSCLHANAGGALAPEVCGLGPSGLTRSTDPQLHGIPQVPPNGGGYAVRIGDAVAGWQRDAIERTFVVTPELARLKFMYAWVLQNPNDTAHNPAGGPNLKPYFDVLADVVGSGTVIDHLHEDGGTVDPFIHDDGNVRVRSWSCHILDFSNYVGQTVRVRFQTSDCALGAHYGYAFVDFPCTQSGVQLQVSTRICDNDPIPARGSSNAGTLEFVWSVEEVDGAGQALPGTLGTLAGTGAPGDIEVRSFYASGGRTILCGHSYRVKLAVRNECEGWIDRSVIVRVLCPPVANAGPDVYRCPPVTTPVVLSAQTTSSDWLYRWYVGNTIVGNGPTLSVTPAITTTYRLVVRHRLLATCTASDFVTVHVLGPFKVEIGACPCGGSTTLTANIAGETGPGTVLTWTPGGQHTPTITVHPSTPTWYTLTVQGMCSTVTASVLVLGAPPRVLNHPNVFTPNGDGINDRFFLTHLGLAIGAHPAYDATEWRFQVYNRWGNLMRTLSGSTAPCETFANGSIPNWDGRNTNGKVVRDGTYYYVFWLRGCGGNLVPVQTGHVQVFD